MELYLRHSVVLGNCFPNNVTNRIPQASSITAVPQGSGACIPPPPKNNNIGGCAISFPDKSLQHFQTSLDLALKPSLFVTLGRANPHPKGSPRFGGFFFSLWVRFCVRSAPWPRSFSPRVSSSAPCVPICSGRRKPWPHTASLGQHVIGRVQGLLLYQLRSPKYYFARYPGHQNYLGNGEGKEVWL